MTGRTGLVIGGAALLACLTACSSAGDLSIWNNGPDDVTVLTGDDEVVVSADGGVDILDYGCTPGDVTVEFSDGESVLVPGPVCPDQKIVIGDGTARLSPADSS